MSASSFGEALSRLWPNRDAKIAGLRAGIIAGAPVVFAKYAITTPLLVAHVMAQISHQYGAGHDVIENLNYTAGRMMQVWPSRISTMPWRRPVPAIRGCCHARLAKSTGLDLVSHPDLVNDPARFWNHPPRHRSPCSRDSSPR
jgi:putative chitinase